ncbi:MAG TPA: sigma-54 dependent transcriptional regulator [Candidatus Eisenbacteria bacterium]|nr:sigma-54 dependent transcriptional regulator [Candidatus Eisenbacteria bacterium]
MAGRGKERIRVLVVEDREDHRRMLAGELVDRGYAVEAVPSGEKAIEKVETEPVDLAVLDVNLPGMDGLKVLEKLSEIAPSIRAIMWTAQGSRQAGFAKEKNAFAYIEKTSTNEQLFTALERAAEAVALRHQVQDLEMGVGPDAIVGESPALRKVLETAARVAPSSAKVMLTGENGTGKDLIARFIHARSRRGDQAFVKLNCAAIPRDLVESELFGHEKGSFTGALQSKKGKFELADGGSLFLDEIGDLGADAQAKLLRAIETGEIERVGGQRPLNVDVRLVAATNRDLPVEVREGRFREDLYFRLNVVPIHVPTLAERADDVPLLARHFLARTAEREGLPAKDLAQDAIALLRGYSWPGNVRELRNMMERAAVLVEGERIEAHDLEGWLEPDEAEDGDKARSTETAGAGGLREEMDRFEANAIRRELEASKWNVTQAATRLGLDRTNLHRKMRKYGIGRHEEEVE